MKGEKIDLGRLGPRALHEILSEAACSGEPAGKPAAETTHRESALQRALGRHWRPTQISALRRDLTEPLSVVELEAWKRRLTDTWSDCTTREERRAVMVFYHAVIANAYARHGEWMTSRTREDLLPVYEDLAHSFVESPLALCFTGAVARAIADGIVF